MGKHAETVVEIVNKTGTSLVLGGDLRLNKRGAKLDAAMLQRLGRDWLETAVKDKRVTVKGVAEARKLLPKAAAKAAAKAAESAKDGGGQDAHPAKAKG